MKTYHDYMNDPDIVNEPMPMREIHAIRLLIQEETRDMTPEQRAEYTQNAVLEAERRLGIKFRRPGDPPMGKVV